MSIETVSEQGLNHISCLVERVLHSGKTLDAAGRAALINLANSCASDEQCFERILTIVVKDVDSATACYRVLKLNSLKLFKAYLSSAGHDETVIFQSMANAIVKLSIRNITLSNELDLYVKLKLSDYGYRKLTGNWSYSEASGGWKSHVSVICQCWDDIVKHKYNVNDDVDDRFLHRVHTIHNHLYFIRLKTFLKHLPVMETLFCLAIFMKIHKNPTSYRTYRFLICKRFVIECLEAIVCQVKHMQQELEKIAQELEQIVTVCSNGIKTVDERSMEQLMKKLEESHIENKNDLLDKFRTQLERPDPSSYEELAKELLSVLRREETIGKIKHTLPCVVHPQNVYVRIMAGITKKTPTETIVSSIVADEKFHFKEKSSLCHGALEAIRRCHSQMKQFYSLVKMHKYVSLVAQADLAKQEHALPCMQRSMMMIGEAFNDISKLDLNNSVTRLADRFEQSIIMRRNTYAHDLVGVTETPAEIALQNWPLYMHAIRMVLVLMLGVIAVDIRHTFYRNLHRCETLDSLRALLTYTGESDCLRELENSWYENALNCPAEGSIGLEEMCTKPTKQTDMIDISDETKENMLKFQHFAKELLQELQAVENQFDFESVRKTCFASGELFTVKKLLSWKMKGHVMPEISNLWHTQILLKVMKSGEVLELLDSKPFYEMDQSIYFIDSIYFSERMYYRGIESDFINKLTNGDQSFANIGMGYSDPHYKNIFRLEKKWSELKEFCTKFGIEWDDKLASEFQRKDRQNLQALFDERRTRLCTLFEQCAIQTEDDLVHKIFNIPLDVRVAMEYIQVEMCNMLLTVKYFGDNFPALKHSLPMIQGKSYRNYLAHDGLSYDLVTNSGEEKSIINAFVFANRTVQLFSKRSKLPSLNFPSFEDAARWIDQQQELRSAIESRDVHQVEAKLKAGAEMKGKFYRSPDVRYHPTKLHSLADLVERCSQATTPIIALLSHYFPSFRADYHSEQRHINNALARRDFEAVYGKIFEKQELRKELLAWSHLPLEYVEVLITNEGWANVLKALFDYGNSPVALEVIKRYEHLLTTKTDSTAALMNDLLQHAMLHGMAECRNVLFSKMCCRLLPKTLELAIAIHWTDLMKHDAAKPVLDDVDNWKVLVDAAVLVSNYQAMGYFLDRGQHKECYSAAVSYGTTPVLEHLVKQFPIEDDKFLSELLLAAAETQIWSSVRLLLEKGVCAGKALPTLVQHGMIDLIRCIKRLDCVELCSSVSNHPFIVASNYGTLSDEMFDVIKSFGFCCFDNPKVLHEMIRKARSESICEEITCRPSNRSPLPSAHCEQMTNALSRWKKIAFLEKSFEGHTTLSMTVHFLNISKLEAVERVLNLARDMRRLEDLVLGDIAIGKGTSIVRYGSERYGQEMADSCDRLMKRIEDLHNASGELHWQDFTMDVYTTSDIKFSVLGATNEDPKDLPTQVQISGSNLTDKLLCLRTKTDELFGKDVTVYATLATESCILVFLKIDEWSCVYDLYPSNSTVDLSNTVNARLYDGKTVLNIAIEQMRNVDLIKLLVENGANPLLSTDSKDTALSFVLTFNYSEMAFYLLKTCKERNLHNENGGFLEQLNDKRARERLLELAIKLEYHEVIEFVANLSQASMLASDSTLSTAIE